MAFIYSSVKSSSSVADPCIPMKRVIPVYPAETTNESRPEFSRRGMGDFDECQSLLKNLLRLDSECSDLPCSFAGIYQPPINLNRMEFYGFSEYWYSMHDVLGLGGRYKYDDLMKKAGDFCSTSWDTLMERYHRKHYRKVDKQRME